MTTVSCKLYIVAVYGIFVLKDGEAAAAEATTVKKTSKVSKSKPVVTEV